MVNNHICLFNDFWVAFSIVINLSMNIAYYYNNDTPWPNQLINYKLQWAREGDLNKLLSTTIKFNLGINKENKFLVQKIRKKLF